MTEKEVVDAWKNAGNTEIEGEKELTTNELIGLVARNQVTQNENLKTIKNYLGFFVLMAILGLILGFCSAAL